MNINMPVVNIVDHRTNVYKVDVMIVFEDAWHDNTVNGATQFPNTITEDEVVYIGIRNTTINQAISYADKCLSTNITMFIYDLSTDNYCDYDHISDNNLIK